MTNKEAIEVLKNDIEICTFDQKDACEMAIKALEQQPCEDAISRTELLARIDAERKHLLDIKMDGAEHIIVHHARRIIEDMPSVTPQQPCDDCRFANDNSICEVCCHKYSSMFADMRGDDE